MNREQAINYLRSSGMSNEQIESVCEGLGCAPTIVSGEAIVLDFTNITEEQKQQLVNLLSKTRIKAINKDVIWQNGYYACLNDKSIRESNWIPVNERLPDVAKKCIVQLTDGHITIGSYHSINRWTFQETSVRYAYPKESVIAWMPLPEPYFEEIRYILKENDNEA